VEAHPPARPHRRSNSSRARCGAHPGAAP
jgi:hypothetical protein